MLYLGLNKPDERSGNINGTFFRDICFETMESSRPKPTSPVKENLLFNYIDLLIPN